MTRELEGDKGKRATPSPVPAPALEASIDTLRKRLVLRCFGHGYVVVIVRVAVLSSLVPLLRMLMLVIIRRYDFDALKLSQKK